MESEVELKMEGRVEEAQYAALMVRLRAIADGAPFAATPLNYKQTIFHLRTLV